MKKLFALGILCSVFFIPATSHAAITITNVTVNGATSTQVKPLSIVRVSMTVQVTQNSKWEGVQWGINNSGAILFPAFVNIDDNDRRDYDGDGWRDDDHKGRDDYRNSCSQNHSSGNGTYTEKFYIIAPRAIGIYNANFQAFEKKKHERKPTATGNIFVLPNAIRVGTPTTTPPVPDTQAPVIAPHADISVLGTASGTIVTYADPTATDNKDASVAVSCIPASGSLFEVGTTTVICDAQDAAGNNATAINFSVGVYTIQDTVAPTIAPHEDITVPSNTVGKVVTYTNPTATDNVDASVAVSCTPPSGSFFPVGPTVVTCTAQDAAGNAAVPTTFTVTPVPTPVTIASQPDESFLCTPDWENCFTGGLGQVEIPLGAGSGLGAGSLLSVTIAKDENSPFVSQPWIIQLACYTDSSYTTTCPDWVQPNSWNGFRSYFVTESSTSSTDGKHWTAYFTNPSREANADLSSPVVFKPAYYYKLIINDNGYNIGAYGSPTLQLPYYVITGMTI